MQLQAVTSQFIGLMNRSDLKLNTSLQTTFLNQGIMRIQRELRVPFMEKIIDYTIPTPATGATTATLAIPSDLLELIDLSVDSDGDGIIDYPMQRVQLRDAQKASELIDIPKVFARKGGNWILGPAPAVGSMIEIVYYAEFAPLINPTDETTLSIIGWDAIVYSALVEAARYYNDDRLDNFEEKYMSIMQALQSMADADELTADAAVRPALILNGDYSQTDGMCW